MTDAIVLSPKFSALLRFALATAANLGRSADAFFHRREDHLLKIKAAKIGAQDVRS
jgi:hypothetical protein